MSTGNARAREPIPCLFVVTEPCMEHCPNRAEDGGSCELARQIPEGEDPREWYVKAMNEVASW